MTTERARWRSGRSGESLTPGVEHPQPSVAVCIQVELHAAVRTGHADLLVEQVDQPGIAVGTVEVSGTVIVSAVKLCRAIMLPSGPVTRCANTPACGCFRMLSSPQPISAEAR